MNIISILNNKNNNIFSEVLPRYDMKNVRSIFFLYVLNKFGI